MIELNKAQMKSLLPLFTGQTPLELQFALEFQYAYYDENPFGSMPGIPVYADNAQNPNIVLIGSVGYLHLFGNAEQDESGNDLLDVINHLYANSDEKIFFNLYSPNWEQKLDKLFSGYRKDTWTRYNYRLNKESFAPHRDWRSKIPAGYVMQYFDVSSDEFLDKHQKGRDFWFPASKRFGWALLKDDEIVSECCSVYYEKEACDANTARVVEIGIETKEPYRRQGLAYLTSSAFIEHCLQHGYEPNWGCWHFRSESRALARKLGFEEISQRRVLIFE